MSLLPEAIPCPDKPPLHLRGGYLCVAIPGDFREACFSAPAIRALRRFRPRATMAVVCLKSQAPLWEMMNEVDHVLSYPDGASASQIAQLIKSQKTTYESSIAWNANEAAKAFLKAKIYQRLGYPEEGLSKYVTDKVDVTSPAPGPVQHRVRYYLDLVKRLGGNAYVASSFQTTPLPESPEKPCIVLAPSSVFGSSYEWSLESFAEVVKLVSTKYPDMEWLIVPEVFHSKQKKGQGTRARLHTLLSEFSAQLLPEMKLDELIPILQKSSALLAVDSHMAHLAAHLGLPATVIFGPNEPEWKRPLGKQSQVVREHVACSPCYLAKCPMDHRCQTAVTVELVVEQVETSLKLRQAFC